MSEDVSDLPAELLAELRLNRKSKSGRYAEIRRLRADGMKLSDIAARYGVSHQRVQQICGPVYRMSALERALRAELEMYREAALYDACMSGPMFKGWNRSALDRARRVTEERSRREAEVE